MKVVNLLLVQLVATACAFSAGQPTLSHAPAVRCSSSVRLHAVRMDESDNEEPAAVMSDLPQKAPLAYAEGGRQKALETKKRLELGVVAVWVVFVALVQVGVIDMTPADQMATIDQSR